MMKKYRTILVTVLILVVVGATAYEYYLPIYQQQQVQQDAIMLLKEYNVYDPNYNYTVFGLLQVDSLLSGVNQTEYISTSTYFVESNILPNVTEQLYTYTNFQITNTEGTFEYNPGELYTYTYAVGTSTTAQVLYHTAAFISYYIRGGQNGLLGFNYDYGPTCKQGSKACSFILMLIDTQSTEQFPSDVDPKYVVLDHLGGFYLAPLQLVADWRFYFVSASPL